MDLVSIIDLPQKRKLTIAVPDLTALYINTSFKAWKTYREIRSKEHIDSSVKKSVEFTSDTISFDALENLAASVIFSYTAIESFCNDSIPYEHEFWHQKRSGTILEKSDKKQLERNFSTERKLNEVLTEIYKVEPPKGKNPVWASFEKLKKCRDGLIHAKSHETRSVGSGEKNLWNYLFTMEAPHKLSKDVFNWYLKNRKEVPNWYKKYPK